MRNGLIHRREREKGLLDLSMFSASGAQAASQLYDSFANIKTVCGFASEQGLKISSCIVARVSFY
jgi:hypothetical protein